MDTPVTRPRFSSSRAFTLIELLVVITIVVVLLALLAPAMDKAVYQAELAVCGARLHGLGTGVLSYASANKRRYPNRPFVLTINGAWPNQLNGGTTGAVDVRPLIRDYLSVNGSLNCSLAPRQVDLDTRKLDAANRLTLVFSSYELWFGWQYGGGGPEEGMFKMGDRFTYTVTGDNSTAPFRHTFRLLASDTDVARDNDEINYTSHPDQAGVLAPWVVEDQTYQQDNQDPLVSAAGTAGTSYTFSWWRSSFQKRGRMDANYLADDNSVLRYNGVERLDDPRMVRVPSLSKVVDTRWIQIPER